MEASIRFFGLLILLTLTNQKVMAGIDEEMEALENDLKKHTILKSNQKSLQDMSTEELIEEIKKDISSDKIANKEKKDNLFKNNLENNVVTTADKKSILDMSTEELIAELKKEEKSAANDNNSHRERFHNIIEKAASHKTVAHEDKLLEAVKNINATEIGGVFKLFDKALLTIAELKKAGPNDIETQLKAIKLLKQLTHMNGKKVPSENDKEQKKMTEFLKNLKTDSDLLRQKADSELDIAQFLAELKAEGEKSTEEGINELKSLIARNETINNHIKSIAKLSDELLKLMADDIIEDAKKNVTTNEKRDAVVVTTDDSCKDTRADCDNLIEYCEEPAYRKKLSNICGKTCKFCEPCVDKWNTQYGQVKCRIILKSGRCTNALAAKLCIKTCGYCKVNTPPKCSSTMYGCCWDKITKKVDAIGSNCPGCEDKYRYVCKEFKVDCNNFNVAGDFMRKNCPATCDTCSESCRDDKAISFSCPVWKDDLDWCKKRPDLMKHFCPATCNFC